MRASVRPERLAGCRRQCEAGSARNAVGGLGLEDPHAGLAPRCREGGIGTAGWAGDAEGSSPRLG